MALLYVEGGKEEQTCPRAAATPQDPVVTVLAHNLGNPVKSHTLHILLASSWCRQVLHALSRAGSLRTGPWLGHSRQPRWLAEEK